MNLSINVWTIKKIVFRKNDVFFYCFSTTKKWTFSWTKSDIHCVYNTTVTDTHCVQYMSQESFVSHSSTHIHTIGQYLVNTIHYKHLSNTNVKFKISWIIREAPVWLSGGVNLERTNVFWANIYEIHLTWHLVKLRGWRFPLCKTMICTIGKIRISYFPNSTDDGFT